MHVVQPQLPRFRLTQNVPGCSTCIAKVDFLHRMLHVLPNSGEWDFIVQIQIFEASGAAGAMAVTSVGAC